MLSLDPVLKLLTRLAYVVAMSVLCPHIKILREGFKNPSHGNCPLTFFRKVFWNRPAGKGGGSTPPFPLRKNPLKIGPKTVFFGQKPPFSVNKISVFGNGFFSPQKTAFFAQKTLFLGLFLMDFFLTERGVPPPPPP